MATLGLTWLKYLRSKYGEDGIGRIATLKAVK
jgi:hypothetical protein